MVKSSLFFAFVLFSQLCFSQIQEPVKWNFSAKKINATTYEIHLNADISGKWHLYSQTTPDGGPVATTISFSKNPIIITDGSVKEMGSLIVKREDVFDMDVKYYNQTVDFVQIIKLKANVKTNINATVKYMVCNDKECLPPTTINFKISIN